MKTRAGNADRTGANDLIGGSGWGPDSLIRDYSPDVGPPEVAALKQQRLIPLFRQRIRETIAEVQSSGVAALPKIEKSLTSQAPLLKSDRLNRNAGPVEE